MHAAHVLNWILDSGWTGETCHPSLWIEARQLFFAEHNVMISFSYLRRPHQSGSLIGNLHPIIYSPIERTCSLKHMSTNWGHLRFNVSCLQHICEAAKAISER